jgi:hypothetical protein
MKKNTFLSLFAAVLPALLFVQCRKDNLQLSGSPSAAGFTFSQAPAGDTLPYPCRIDFLNGSSEAFLYQWNFGDNSALSPLKDPSHVYAVGGTYNVTLTSVGTNGNNSITKVVSVLDACQNDFFSKLTNCSFAEWTWSNDADAIRVLSPDGNSVYFSGAPAGCQADDVYKFSANGAFDYNANGQTFDVQAGYSCQAPKPNAMGYRVLARSGQNPVICLDSLTIGSGKPFIGTTDLVDSNRYEVMAYTATTLTLRGKIQGSGGILVEVKLKKVVALTLEDIRNLLTGGGSRSWKLDPAAGANPIVVGTEGNPSEYYGGGPLAACQLDDIYTFTSANTLSYNAAGSTFNGGNISPNYNCGDDRSFSNVGYTFGATTPGIAGLATIKLPSAPPATFIGTTDVPAENVYRIIEINAAKMILRGGNGSSTVFQFKFIPQ